MLVHGVLGLSTPSLHNLSHSFNKVRKTDSKDSVSQERKGTQTPTRKMPPERSRPSSSRTWNSHDLFGRLAAMSRGPAEDRRPREVGELLFNFRCVLHCVAPFLAPLGIFSRSVAASACQLGAHRPPTSQLRIACRHPGLMQDRVQLPGIYVELTDRHAAAMFFCHLRTVGSEFDQIRDWRVFGEGSGYLTPL